MFVRGVFDVKSKSGQGGTCGVSRDIAFDRVGFPGTKIVPCLGFQTF